MKTQEKLVFQAFLLKLINDVSHDVKREFFQDFEMPLKSIYECAGFRNRNF